MESPAWARKILGLLSQVVVVWYLFSSEPPVPTIFGRLPVNPPWNWLPFLLVPFGLVLLLWDTKWGTRQRERLGQRIGAILGRGRKEMMWVHLEVENSLEDSVIHSCLCMIQEFRPLFALDLKRYKLPPKGHELPWASKHQVKRRRMDLGAGASASVDVAIVGGALQKDEFGIPELRQNDQYAIPYTFPTGKYEVDMWFGSDSEDIRPTLVLVTLAYDGGKGIQIEVAEEEGKERPPLRVRKVRSPDVGPWIVTTK